MIAAPPVANAGDDVVAAALPIATGVDEVAAAIGGEVSTDGGEVSSLGGDVSSLGGEVSSDDGDISVGDEPGAGYVSVGKELGALGYVPVGKELGVGKGNVSVGDEPEPIGYVSVGDADELDTHVVDDEISVTSVEETMFVGALVGGDVGPAGEDDVGLANDDEDDPPPVPVKAVIPVARES